MPAVRHARAELVTARGDRQTGTWIITGENLRCFTCGSEDVFSVSPGEDGESIQLLGQPVALRRSIATRALCLDCFLGPKIPLS